MSKLNKIPGTEEAWETGKLGQDIAHAERADPEMQKQINESLGMQSISIRLQTELIEEFKLIAKLRGTGYQPLMREALHLFAQAEIKKIAVNYAATINNSDNKAVKKKTTNRPRVAA